MYLLSRDGRYQLRLTEFTQNDLPPYAILSHRWGIEEVSYHNVLSGSYREKSGYAKLDFCLNQAAKDGLRYCWVDTCCIKFESAIDVSTAINSMFEWYRMADKCYVYLSDVSEEGFWTSNWFTRGWTLQELLAPKHVDFFSATGRFLGDKRSLENKIHGRTQIPIEALRGQALADFSVDERLSWIRERETTFEEDMVYSLLGIFDISMPLLYGEGKENALDRLRKCIEEKSTVEAETTYQQTPEGSEKALGLEHISTLNTVSDLGNLYTNQGKLAEAEAMYERAGEGRDEVLESEYASTLQTFDERLDDATVLGDRIQFPTEMIPHIRLDSEDEEDRLTLSDMGSVHTGIDSEQHHFPTAQTAIEDNDICNFLCAVPEIRHLCINAAARGNAGQQQLCQNVVKALKRLYISCRDRVEKDTDDIFLSRYQAALRFRKRRLVIAWRTIGRIVSESASLRPVELETIDEESSDEADSDNDLDSPSPIEVAANLASVEPAPATNLLNDYNKHGEFTELLISLSLKTIPVHLRTMLTEAPTGSLCIVDNAEHSLLNKLKVYVERHTRTQWSWEPVLHPLTAEKTRLFYTCTCGEQFVRVLSREVATVVDNILKLKKTLKKDFGHRCSIQNRDGEHLPGPATSSRRQTTSCGTAYQRIWNWLATTFSRKYGPPDESRIEDNPPHNDNSHDKQSKQSRDEPQIIDRWIIVGFQSLRPSLEIEHISVDESKLDSNFFKELKQRFRYHVPFWKRWLSIWELYSCQYVQFDKICADDVYQEAHRWPAPHQVGYYFMDWASDKKDPPISESLFHKILKRCDDTCLLKRLHICMSLGNLKTRDFIQKMPQKLVIQFDHKSDGTGIAWGIQPLLRPRPGMITVYVLLAFATICTAFIILWLKWTSQHPDDLQNASVPLLVFLAFIGVVAQVTWMAYSFCTSLHNVKTKID